jgi:protein-disulfide isomerase
MIRNFLIYLWFGLMATCAAANQESIYTAGDDVVLGNNHGEITVAAFSDYSCIHCRKMARTLNVLAQSDPKVRIVLVEYPILSSDSVFAAKAAMASRYQAAYLRFHQSLMTEPLPLTPKVVLETASRLGLKQDELIRDMKSNGVMNTLQRNFSLGNEFNIKALPTFIVGITDPPHHELLLIAANGEQLLRAVHTLENQYSGKSLPLI